MIPDGLRHCLSCGQVLSVRPNGMGVNGMGVWHGGRTTAFGGKTFSKWRWTIANMGLAAVSGGEFLLM